MNDRDLTPHVEADIDHQQVITIREGFFNESLHEYYDQSRVIVPSTTQILEGVGFIDLDGVPEEKLENKRNLGDAVHFATRIIDNNRFFGGPELDWDTVHEKCVPYVLAHESFMAETGFIPEEVEQGGVCTVNGMKFGYTRDRVGRLPGFNGRFVVELKCAYKEEASWKYQLSAYQKTIDKKEAISRIAVQYKPDATFKIYRYDNPRNWDVFLWALGITYAKINDGLPWRKQ